MKEAATNTRIFAYAIEALMLFAYQRPLRARSGPSKMNGVDDIRRIVHPGALAVERRGWRGRRRTAG
jgi:hypothetical protein